jgi:hypothetical protein
MLLGLTSFAILVLLPYVLGPVLVRLTQRASRTPRFDPYDPAHHRTPSSIVTSAQEVAAGLTAAGFEQVADVFQTGYIAGMASRLVLFERKATGQRAASVGIYIDAEPTRIVANYVEVVADFSDGRSLVVNNAATFGANAPVPGKMIEQFPAVRDPARLAAIHEKLIERTRGDASVARRDLGQDIGAYLTDMLVREMEEQVPLGYFWLDGGANAYRPTWKGATLMCWKLLPPMSTLRHRQIRRRAAQLLAELALDGGDARPVTTPAVTPSPMTQRLSWAAAAAIGVVAAYLASGNTAPAGALEPGAAPSVVPANFEVPTDFPGAVLALERLAANTAEPLVVRDSLGSRVKVSGVSIPVPAALADSLLVGAQRRFLERGFFLFRHEPNYGLNGRPDRLALVPVWDQFRVVKLVGTSGLNYDISNAAVIAWLRALEQEAPFVLTGIGDDHVEGRFTGRLADPESMAQRVYRFCPDVVEQGTGSVTGLATELRRRNTFYCWWD